jgi:hypothetical protein
LFIVSRDADRRKTQSKNCKDYSIHKKTK